MEIFVPDDPTIAPRTRIKRALKGCDLVEPLEGSLALSIEIISIRPASHFRRDGSLKSGVPTFPSTATNPAPIVACVRKALLDVVHESRRQIVTLIVQKRFGPESGLTIRVQRA